MSNIIKLVQLDKALLKPYYKYFLVMIFATVPMMFGFKAIIPSIVFAMSMIAMTSNYTFSVAEKNDLNRLYGLLPVSKKDIVAGRYFFTAIIGFVAIAIMVVLNLIVLTIAKVTITNEEVLLGIGSGIIVYFLFTAIQLPGLFKFGSLKGRLFSFVPFIGIFSASASLNSIRISDTSPSFSLEILNSPYALLIFAVLTGVVLYGISLGISQKIYDKMEL
ncbi:MAG TPA: ABC-2 transporter permease [Ruminiclostridium sp.]